MIRVRWLSAPGLLASSALILLPATASPLAAQEAGADEAPAAAQEAAPEAATDKAMSWLALVDEGDYEGSWKQSAGSFQDAVTPSVWETSVTDARSQFEPFGERTSIGSRQITDPPGAPPGDYVILQYRTEASGDRTVVETVALVKEGEAWKVGGYFVQPE